MSKPIRGEYYLDIPAFEWIYNNPKRRRRWTRVEAMLDTKLGREMGPDVCELIWRMTVELEYEQRRANNFKNVMWQISQHSGRNGGCRFRNGQFYWHVIRLGRFEFLQSINDDTGEVRAEDHVEVWWIDGSVTYEPVRVIQQDAPEILHRHQDIWGIIGQLYDPVGWVLDI